MCLKQKHVHQAQREHKPRVDASRCLWTTAGASTCFSTKDFIEGRQHFGRAHYHVDVEGGQKIPVLIKDIQVDRFVAMFSTSISGPLICLKTSPFVPT